MGHLLPALSEEKFATEREVVLNERRQNYENRPYGLSSVALAEALFPDDHPYHWVTIGAPADLVASSVDDARAFFRAFYHPGNASLAIAGDVDARRGVRRSSSATSATCRPAPRCMHPQRSARRWPARRGCVLEDRVELPRLSTGVAHARDVPRRRRRAGHRRRRARQRQDVAALPLAGLRRAAGRRRLGACRRRARCRACSTSSATAAPGRRWRSSTTVIARTLDELAATGPTADELERATARAEAQFVYRVQTIGGFGGKSDQLNAYNVFTGSPGYFARRSRPLCAGRPRRRWPRRCAAGCAMRRAWR